MAVELASAARTTSRRSASSAWSSAVGASWSAGSPSRPARRPRRRSSSSAALRAIPNSQASGCRAGRGSSSACGRRARRPGRSRPRPPSGRAAGTSRMRTRAGTSAGTARRKCRPSVPARTGIRSATASFTSLLRTCVQFITATMLGCAFPRRCASFTSLNRSSGRYSPTEDILVLRRSLIPIAICAAVAGAGVASAQTGESITSSWAQANICNPGQLGARAQLAGDGSSSRCRCDSPRSGSARAAGCRWPGRPPRRGSRRDPRSTPGARRAGPTTSPCPRATATSCGRWPSSSGRGENARTETHTTGTCTVGG